MKYLNFNKVYSMIQKEGYFLWKIEIVIHVKEWNSFNWDAKHKKGVASVYGGLRGVASKYFWPPFQSPSK